MSLIKNPPPSSLQNVGGDLDRLRRRIRVHAQRFSECDYDAINALLTLKRTASELQAIAERSCQRANVSSGRLGLLMTLHAAPQNMMALSELGDCMIVTRPNITGLVDGLVEDGLVRRVAHPGDRRVILAQLTEQGQALMRRFAPKHFSTMKAALSGLSTGEQRRLVVLLDKLRRGLSGGNGRVAHAPAPRQHKGSQRS